MPLFVSQSEINSYKSQIETLEKQVAWYNEFYHKFGGKEAFAKGKLLDKLSEEVAAKRAEKDALESTLTGLHVEEFLTDYSLFDLEEIANTSLNLQLKSQKLTQRIKEAMKSDWAEWHRTKVLVGLQPENKTVLNKTAKNITKLAMQSFNNQAKALLDKVTPANYVASVDRLGKQAKSVEKLAEMIELHISDKYIRLWADAMKNSVELQKARAVQKELEREHKAALREAAKVERELEAERAKLEKEKQHYLNVLETLKVTGDTVQIEKMEAKLADVNKAIENVDYRKANQRAGYVYVISNIGSFGDRMVKIGMTRRLDPLDRVRELSDASVPFNFDVHALFFSEDAVRVETDLHHAFASKRVNLVNPRREFFAVTPAEVKVELAKIKGALIEFVDEPDAEQYRESCSIRARNEHTPEHAQI